MKKPTKKPATKLPAQKISLNKPEETGKKPFFKLEIPALPRLTPYLPGILLFLAALIIGLLTYKDYGVSWDEPEMRAFGLINYNYIFNDNKELLNKATAVYGAGYELLLTFFEKWMNLTDTRDIYLMRHLVSHIFFLFSALSFYILAYRLFKSKFIACLGFIMLVLTPRIYAHSFFNTKDLSFLCMFPITLTFFQIAFEKNRLWLYLILGILCGYTTSMRIMGIMLCGFILIFLLIDLVTKITDKKKIVKQILNILIFSFGFCFMLYFAWPYLWKDPINNFIASFNQFSHFNLLNFNILFEGEFHNITNIPWNYMPTWFIISNPEVWLIAGFAGIIWIIINFLKKPLNYLKNSQERNFFLYFICFFTPITAVIFLHSAIYNDWRHLYFVYPSFILIALYFINKIYQSKYRLIIQSVCIVQIGLISYFMIKNHPFNQIYFNNFVSHAPQNLLKNFELEYWGCSYKQGLEYLLNTDHSKTIKIYTPYKILLDNNILLLPEEDRKRIIFADMGNAEYFIPMWYEPNMPVDNISTKIDSITILNSTIFCIIKKEKNPEKQKQMRKDAISNLNKLLATDPTNFDAQAKISNAYFGNEQYDSAAFHYMQFIQLNHANPKMINDIAMLFFNSKQFTKTIAFCNYAIKLKPDYVDAYMNMAASYINLYKFDSGMYCLNKTISINPTNGKAYEYFSIVYKAIGKVDSVKKYDALSHKYK